MGCLEIPTHFSEECYKRNAHSGWNVALDCSFRGSFLPQEPGQGLTPHSGKTSQA